MPRLDLDASTLTKFERRVATLPADATRRWGTMTLAQMLAHLRVSLEVSLQERQTTDESRAWLLPILWVLMFEVWTSWPRGLIKTTPQFLDNSATDVEAERQAVLAAMQRFVERAAQAPERRVLEPMLGQVSLRKWRRIHGIHIDYHLRQFGG